MLPIVPIVVDGKGVVEIGWVGMVLLGIGWIVAVKRADDIELVYFSFQVDPSIQDYMNWRISCMVVIVLVVGSYPLHLLAVDKTKGRERGEA